MYNLELNSNEKVTLILALRHEAKEWGERAKVLINDRACIMCVQELNSLRNLILKIRKLKP